MWTGYHQDSLCLKKKQKRDICHNAITNIQYLDLQRSVTESALHCRRMNDEKKREELER